jgi:hypothetical protein
VWRGDQEISQALASFMGDNLNHAHLPSGGGLDFLSVGPSAEVSPQTIEEAFPQGATFAGLAFGSFE